MSTIYQTKQASYFFTNIMGYVSNILPIRMWIIYLTVTVPAMVPLYCSCLQITVWTMLYLNFWCQLYNYRTTKHILCPGNSINIQLSSHQHQYHRKCTAMHHSFDSVHNLNCYGISTGYILSSYHGKRNSLCCIP